MGNNANGVARDSLFGSAALPRVYFPGGIGPIADLAIVNEFPFG